MKIPFLGLPDGENPRVAIIPIPFEFTTTWLKGTKFAPQEILKVSPNLEFFDEELLLAPHEIVGFYTEPLWEPSLAFNEALSQVEALAKHHARKGCFAIYLGGEHTITYPIILAYREIYPNLRILHLDAHLDQRDSYLNSKLNHATVMKRISELGVPIFSLGLRAISLEEKDTFIKERERIVLAEEFFKDKEGVLERVSQFLSEGPAYLSLDMDVLDPSLAPGVGTPEPGGLTWQDLLKILANFMSAKPVAMDIVEVRPFLDPPMTEYLAAKIILKVSAYLSKNLK